MHLNISGLLFPCKMLKDGKIKKGKIGSEVTIYLRGRNNGLSILPNPDDQNPNSKMALVSNPGGAISFLFNINGFLNLSKKEYKYLNRISS